jgi:hypothetical protein
MTTEKAQLLADELASRFTAHVEIENISPGRFRFEVYSKSFRDVPFLDRQDQAWEVVNRLLNREEKDDVSLLLTIGPEDVDASLVALMP